MQLLPSVDKEALSRRIQRLETQRGHLIGSLFCPTPPSREEYEAEMAILDRELVRLYADWREAVRFEEVPF